jgi:hypothetical protein
MLFEKNNNKISNHLTIPQEPWENRIVISASGIIAGGWTNDNKVFMLCSDGYSISNPITGEREIRNRDENNSAMNKFSADNLEFEIEEFNQRIKIFGLREGKLIGLQKSYRNGILTGTKEFENRMQNGYEILYDYTGKNMMWKIHYVNGKKHGRTDLVNRYWK